jgi:sulfonate transport system substrate-binding protein
MRRRDVLAGLLGTAAACVSGRVVADPDPKEFRVGYQKNGILVIARQQGALEKRLAPRRIEVKWIEFTSGPPLLEAMNVGSIDIGHVGDTPPIFAQAAGATIVYVAGQPTTTGQGILVRPGLDVRTLADLKGKRVAFTRGSSAHNVAIVALEKAGLTFNDITPVYLNPPDAVAAFSRGSIDVWAIWDPYFAIGEKHGGRILIETRELTASNSFYIANRGFAQRNPHVLRDVIDALGETAQWAEANRDKVAKALADVTGIELEIQKVAADRGAYAIGRITDDIVVTQQAVADRFHRLGIIPRAINVREAVWVAPQS